MVFQGMIKHFIGLAGLALALLMPGQVLANPATPDGTYLVTSSSDAAITTCAGGANDCSLRGAVQRANASAGGDTISFSPSVTVVVLNSSIVVTGGAIHLTGNGPEATRLKTAGAFAALFVASNGNSIHDLAISANGAHAGYTQDGIVISGSFNLISHTNLFDLGGSGLEIQAGNGNTVTDNLIGLPSFNGSPQADCASPNGAWGIDLTNSANNLIQGNTIGCNTNDGVQLAGAQTTSNIVQRNSIGLSGTQAISNTHDGIDIHSGAHATQVLTNTLVHNRMNGISMWGSDTPTCPPWPTTAGRPKSIYPARPACSSTAYRACSSPKPINAACFARRDRVATSGQ